ncbi:hypothetical protein GCM10012290_18360 [Halolactibacillus alkaliphilus]|uniref:FtsK domain-containing protein n=1 Tax=Halolactibacillus alkaliphilus TaxID=442899 RepID=A0A511X2W9_9BACI|nr:DNA translocase FtsK [Halolactibacillus alkaliphilus]GEN57296.1 hypothetical protein HAL01_17600 [Halolactibacillus alkaliphilus]GGN72403.1 hypothetical protein GCM10012290_18360 [Halolactibacillus alkaliphilus]SFO89475.1 DNA segregation ATPase FtsK/SpoIIIE, S-DNA-T family [Halolactibacillus alkaliphilus]
MWNKLKQRIDQLFHSNDNVQEVDHPDKLHNEQDVSKVNKKPYQRIDTKVVYHYPKEREFKFPVKIDEVGMNREHSSKKYKKEKELPTNMSKDRETPPNNKPFKVSEVPSPVYGFTRQVEQQSHEHRHDRQKEKKLIESTYYPTSYSSNILNEVRRTRGEMSDYAYERSGEKRKVQPKDRDIERTEQKKTIEPFDSMEKVNNIDVVNEKQKFKDSSDTTANEAKKDDPTKFVDGIEEKDNESEVGTMSETEILLKRSPVHEQAQRELNKKQVPFNVRMRPSDKKRYYERMKNVDNKQLTKDQHASTNQPPVAEQLTNTVAKSLVNPRQISQKIDGKKRQVLPLHLLDDIVPKEMHLSSFIEEQSQRLIEALKQFNVAAEVINVMQGPSVMRFEIKPESGVKVSKVKNLSDDLKLSLAAKDIRIEAPIPGKHAIGIEIPNEKTRPVMLSEIFESSAFVDATSPLSVGLGLDISGEAIITDIQKMPHGLIAGATGSGKSVCINTILLSLLYKATPEEVRLLLIDPKMVELQPYNDLPHLVSPVITDVKAATQALKWAVEEMERRYQLFVEKGARDLSRYNEKMTRQQGESLPMIVIVIDELADLMMAAPQDVEDAICRIAQKARAAGIHLLLATQRPSVDVITGLIKSNIPTRIAFSVASQVDSRTMIDTAGAERLLGKGDMLFVENGARHPVRIQGAFVSDDEIERITAYLKQQREPNYLFEQEQLLESLEQEASTDELFEDALLFLSENETISTSLLQRRFKIGYNRAARIIDSLEHQGIVSGQNGSKPRTILISKEEINYIRQSHR